MQWIVTVFLRYADFRGRSRRRAFWSWTLFVWITSGALGAAGEDWPVAKVAAGLFSFGTLLPSLAVSVRRLHDTDRRGWWLLLPLGPLFALFLVPFAAVSGSSLPFVGFFAIALLGGLITLLVFLCLDGTRGPNRFGPDPKDPASTDDLVEVFR